MTLIALALVALAGDVDTKVTADFENASVTEVLESLTLVTQVKIELDDAARKKLGDPSQAKVSIRLKDVSVTGALQLLFGPSGLQVKVVDRSKLLVTVAP